MVTNAKYVYGAGATEERGSIWREEAAKRKVVGLFLRGYRDLQTHVETSGKQTERP